MVLVFKFLGLCLMVWVGAWALTTFVAHASDVFEDTLVALRRTTLGLGRAPGRLRYLVRGIGTMVYALGVIVVYLVLAPLSVIVLLRFLGLLP